MFEATAPSLLLDYFRVPYALGAPPLPGCVAVRRGERLLAWPAEAALALAPEREARLAGTRVFGRILDDGAAAGLLRGGWSPREPLLDARGRRLGSIWSGPGGVFLPFDPDAAIRAYWSEGYKRLTGGGGARPRAVANAAYYRLRPLIPRRAQIALRRVASRAQARTPFPRWPLEPALHELQELLLGLLCEVADEPVPTLAPWPRGRSWALVLTHDVETGLGYGSVEQLREVERAAGRRSSWNFVPRRGYAVEAALLRRLAAEGCEIGVHGLYHDGRDVSRRTLAQRLPLIREAAERWGAAGFRAPATRRVWELMPRLGFDYDSSYPDTDPFEPDGGGCCTWLPFFNEGIVELPITLPQDHTVFEILRLPGAGAWCEKADALRRRGGLALLITHPDYMREPERLDAYADFLRAYADDDGAWHALPREVAAWWRRRAASSVEAVADGWQVVGPAAGEAVVRLCGTVAAEAEPGPVAVAR